MIHAATIEKTNRTKGVHNYVYAYVFIWLNQLCNSSLSLIPVLRHGNVQRRPLQPAQEKGMEKCPASLWRNIPVLLSGLPPLMERGVSNGKYMECMTATRKMEVQPAGQKEPAIPRMGSLSGSASTVMGSMQLK